MATMRWTVKGKANKLTAPWATTKKGLPQVGFKPTHTLLSRQALSYQGNSAGRGSNHTRQRQTSDQWHSVLCMYVQVGITNWWAARILQAWLKSLAASFCLGASFPLLCLGTTTLSFDESFTLRMERFSIRTRLHVRCRLLDGCS